MASRTFERKQLYDLVWQTPIRKLALEVGLSDKGLAKLCDRYKIPIPPRGYWAKLAAGKPVSATPLPESPNFPDSYPITITPSQTSKPQIEPEVSLALQNTPKPELVVPARLTRPHPVVKQWQDERKELLQRSRSRGRRDSVYLDFGYKPFSALELRRHRILDTIFKAIEKHGYVVKSGEISGSWNTSYQGVSVEFTITERYKQVKTPVKKGDLVLTWDPGRTHRIERQLTGKLMLNIKTWLPKGMTQRWAEEVDDHPLELDVPDIVRTLIAAGPLLLEQKKEREEELKRYQDEQHRRYLEAERIKKDQECWDRFLAASARSSEAERVRDFIKKIESIADDELSIVVNGQSVAEWISWAKEWVDRHDPLQSDILKLFKGISGPEERVFKSW